MNRVPAPRLLALSLLLGIAVACSRTPRPGRDSVPRTPAPGATATTTTVPASARGSGATTGGAQGSGRVPGAAASPPPSSGPGGATPTTATPGAPSHSAPGTVRGVVTSIQPPCPSRQEHVTVVIQTVPYADISYGTAFADGRPENLYGLARADDRGRFVWTFAVPADAALGDATVTAAASSAQGGGGSGDGTFRVTERGSC